MSSPNKKRIILDSIPNEILQRIVSIAGIKNLIQLLTDSVFILLNQNLSHAINRVILNKPSYKFRNRVTLMKMSPFSSYPWEGIQRKIDLQTEERTLEFTNESFEVFLNYCIHEQLEVNCKITYEIYTIVDYFEFEKLITSITPGGRVKFRLDLDFKDLGCIDGSQILASLSHISDCITELSMLGLNHIVVDVNSKVLEGISLKLSGCKFSSSFTKCSNLVELFLDEQCFDIAQLPQSLKRLHLDCCTISFLDRKKNDVYLPTLQHLTFHGFEEYYDGDSYHDLYDTMNVLPTLISSETTSIDFMFDGEWGTDDWFLEELASIAKKKSLKLESLALDARICDPSLIFPSKLYKFRRYLKYYEDEIRPLPKLSPTLESLFLEESELPISEIFKDNPSSLKELHIRNYDLEGDGNFKVFKNLVSLHLPGSNRRKLIDEILLPDSLEVLTLTRYMLNFDTVKFPKNLTSLHLNAGNITSLDGVTFPPGLTDLKLDYSSINHLRGEVFPSTLKRLKVGVVESVDLSKDRCANPLQLEKLHLVGIKSGKRVCILPCTLQSLHLQFVGPSVFNQLGSELKSLTIKRCSLDLRNLKFGLESKLKYFCMLECHYKTLDMDLPQSITEINLKKNNFLEVPPQLGQLRNLRILKYHQENTLEFNIEFFYNLLEVLDIFCSLADELQLKFPDGDTNLKQLSLEYRGLGNFTMGSIGHRDKTRHSNLLSIRLAQKYITEEQMLALIPNLSKSMHELCGQEYGRRVGVNYLSKESEMGDD